MSGRIITTYMANVVNIEKEIFFKGAVKLYVARGVSGLPELERKGFVQVIGLAPTKDLLEGYKDGKISWEMYVNIFRMDMLDRVTTGKAIKQIKARLNENKVIIFCCYEKDYRKCHRYILSNYFSELGYECGEYQKGQLI